MRYSFAMSIIPKIYWVLDRNRIKIVVERRMRFFVDHQSSLEKLSPFLKTPYTYRL